MIFHFGHIFCTLVSMLYDFHDNELFFLEPSRIYAKNMHSILDSKSIFSQSDWFRSISGFYDIYERSTRRVKKPSFSINFIEIENKKIAVKEKIVVRKPFCDLLNFKKNTKNYEPNVMIIAPLSGHFATLLRDTVRVMIPNHNVFITDWRSASEVPLKFGDFSLDDYLDYLIDFLMYIGPNTHVMAVCQPAVQVIALAAVLNKIGSNITPATIIPMGGPIDPRANPTSVNKFAETYPIEFFRTLTTVVPSGHPGEGRLVYPGFIQILAFISMNPDKHVAAHFKYLEDCAINNEKGKEMHQKFYDEYLSVLDMDATYFLETVEHVFQKYELPRGVMKYHKITIDLSAIKNSALLTIEGERDDISAPGQTYAAHALCTGIPNDKKEHYLQPGVGHYGIFSGSKWRTFIAPKISEFIRKHDKHIKNNLKT